MIFERCPELSYIAPMTPGIYISPGKPDKPEPKPKDLGKDFIEFVICVPVFLFFGLAALGIAWKLLPFLAQSLNRGANPPIPGSLYSSVKLSPFEERRFPVMGDPYTVENPLDKDGMAEVFGDIRGSGLCMDPQNLSKPALQATWKLAKQLGPVKDMPEETSKQMMSLWNALKIANTEQHLLDSIPPEQRSVPAGWASRFASTYGPNIPEPVAGAVKWVTGGNLDVKNTNEPLKELEETHKQLSEAIKAYNQESGADIPGGLRDPHDPDAPTAFRRWEHDWFAPNVAASTDYWTSKNYKMPVNFLHQANINQFGENYPGGYPTNPIVLTNNEQYYKLKEMKLDPPLWVQDAKGVFQLK